ncbi:unnamed protein product [Spirodela intermedia]|uniref:DUF7755 domain-containing protein n=1 Tax=Spirodela intermedia TaxID=51605 RepID=A0A7I8KCB8_SPIIN|nr:unnamed protein product [Spirodela intermedia]
MAVAGGEGRSRLPHSKASSFPVRRPRSGTNPSILFVRLLALPVPLASREFKLSRESPHQPISRFAEPARLLPSREAIFLGETMAGSVLDSANLDESSSFYILQIRTSGEFGSSLSDADAAILLSFIDVNGDSVLQRIPMVSSGPSPSGAEESSSVSEGVHFQRGSVDVLGFHGPKLGDIKALWVGLESGSWRLSGIRLTVVGADGSSSSKLYESRRYDFEADEVFFGGSGGLSMAELRPQLVDGFSMDDPSGIISGDLFQESGKPRVSMEESMEEYSDLKLSLLVYDLLSVTGGAAAVAAVSSSEEAAIAFAAGGACGFLYLLLLQRSVDGLSASALPVAGGGNLAGGGGFRGALWGLALTLLAAGAAVRFGAADGGLALTPRYLFLGLAGFLTCKVSVVLAAFRPLKSLRGNGGEPTRGL